VAVICAHCGGETGEGFRAARGGHQRVPVCHPDGDPDRPDCYWRIQLGEPLGALIGVTGKPAGVTDLRCPAGDA
jgi:hypothetical protein